MSTILEETVKRLNRIAEANHDEFKCAVTIEVRRRATAYRFFCAEPADNHVFVEGIGTTPDDAAKNAALKISEACVAWGYDEVD